MKKILSLFLLTVVALCATAANKQKADSEDTLWGYYMGDGSDLSGLGTQKAGTFGVAIKVPGSGALKGSKITALNLPVIYTGMTNVKVWCRTNIGNSTTAFSQDVTDQLSKGYNKVVLDEPYTLDEDCYIGYTFYIKSATTTDAKYPMAMAQGEAEGSTYLSLDGKTFQDYSDAGYGMSGLQIFVADLNMPDYCAQFKYNSAVTTVMNSVNTLPLIVSFDGAKSVENITYTITVDGVSTQHTTEVSIPSGFGGKAVVNAEFTTPDKAGKYSLTANIDKVNGEDNSFNGEPLALTAQNVTRVADKRVVIEEFTGTTCGYCPRGWLGMERLKKDGGKNFIGIAIHQYDSSDPMYIAQYANLDFDGAPQCCVDRRDYVDPYYGASGENYGIYDVYLDHLQTIPAVDVKVSGTYDETQKKVVANAEVEFLGDAGNYTIAYVLTADSLSGTTTAWKQHNYYNQYTPAQAEAVDDPMAMFCKGGEYGKSTVALVFNDVAISSSYGNGLNKAEALPTEFVPGDVATNSYTLTMPTKSVLKKAIDTELVFVNALVIDEYGTIVNAARARVLTEEEAAGIVEIAPSTQNVERTYNISGMRTSRIMPGVNIVNGKKLLVK